MRVVCYRNLRRQDWSIAEVKCNNGIGRVIAHERSVVLANTTFVVKEPARQRVIRNRCGEVHAWAVSELVKSVPPGRRTAITYDPYRGVEPRSPSARARLQSTPRCSWSSQTHKVRSRATGRPAMRKRKLSPDLQWYLDALRMSR